MYPILAVWSGFAVILNVLIAFVGLFLIGLVLIQRGKGGGLSGAFGGAGGSSAFGSRAGDQFTRITIYVAAFWVILIMIMVKVVAASNVDEDVGPALEQQSQLRTPSPLIHDRGFRG